MYTDASAQGFPHSEPASHASSRSNSVVSTQLLETNRSCLESFSWSYSACQVPNFRPTTRQNGVNARSISHGRFHRITNQITNTNSNQTTTDATNNTIDRTIREPFRNQGCDNEDRCCCYDPGVLEKREKYYGGSAEFDGPCQ